MEFVTKEICGGHQYAPKDKGRNCKGCAHATSVFPSTKTRLSKGI